MPSITALQNGRATMFNVWFEKTSAMVMPRMITRIDFTSRLRNSRRLS